MGLMRLLLAVAVLLWHCPEGIVSRMLHPALAVQCFYAISGFLIQMVIRASNRDLRGWKGRFYLSRWLRIYPLYALFVLLTLACFPNGAAAYYFQKGEYSAGVAWVFTNMLIVGQDMVRILYFNIQTGHWALMPLAPDARSAAQAVSGSMAVVSQSWTLAIEFYFYLLAPFLLTRRARVLVGAVVLSVCLRFALGYAGYCQHSWLYGFFPCELAIFLMGSLAYRAYGFLFEAGRLPLLFGRVAGVYGEAWLLALCSVVVFAVCLVYMTCHLNFAGGQSQWSAPPLGVAPGYWLVLLMTVAALPFAFHFSRKMAWDKFIGELSYPVYISHFLLMQLVTGKLQPGSGGAPYVGAFVMVASILLAVVLVEFIEKPVDRVRHRLSRRAPALAVERAVTPIAAGAVLEALRAKKLVS